MENAGTAVLRALKKRWWVTVLVAGAALATGAVLTSRETPRYRTNTLLVVVPNSRVESNTDVLRSLETLERRTVVATFAKIAAARETRNGAAKRLGLEPNKLSAYHVSAAVLPNTNIIRIDVAGPDREQVAEVANAAASHVRRKSRRLYRIYSLVVVAPAESAYRPYHPDPRRNLLVAGLLGLFLGAIAAYSVEAALSR